MWHQLRGERADIDEIGQLLDQSKCSVHAAQRAGATVAVEGPPAVIDVARTLLDDLAVLYAVLAAYSACRAAHDDPTEHIATCARQRHQVRMDIDAFATAAQAALSDRGLEGRRL
ncbi:hypothetical protein [Streptomyces rochei]|uniref:hypothetical protein n=1 Tax=Streptomyces rochei TaxID=1928 RepID=UPI003685CE1D